MGIIESERNNPKSEVIAADDEGEVIYDWYGLNGNEKGCIYKTEEGIEIESYSRSRNSAWISEFFKISDKGLKKLGEYGNNLWDTRLYGFPAGEALIQDLKNYVPTKVKTCFGVITDKKELESWASGE